MRMYVNGEALHAVYIKLFFFFNTSHMGIRIRYYKSCALRLNMQDSYDKTITTIVPSYAGRKYHSFVAVGIVIHAAHS